MATVDIDSLKPNSQKYKTSIEGNSLKEEEVTREKKTEKVISGEVVERDKPLFRRFLSDFFSGDAKTACEYVIHDVILPSVKRLFLEALNKGGEMLLFDSITTRSSSRSGNEKVSYASFYKSDKKESSNYIPQQRYDYRNIVLSTRGEAEEVIDVLTGIVEEYGRVSVADLYDACGITGNFTDNKYGWTSASGFRARITKDGYLLDFPRATPID